MATIGDFDVDGDGILKTEKNIELWIIFVDHPDRGRYYRHETFESAKTEAERLARLPGDVYLFECVGRCRVGEAPIVWEK